MPAKILTPLCFMFAATQAAAAPLDRLPGADYLVYESGNVAALSFIGVRPSLSGQLSVPPGTASGQIAPSFQSGRIGLKYDLGSDRHIEFSLNTPWGVDTAFPAGTGFPTAGLSLSAEALRATLIYRQSVAKGWDVIVGLNAEQLSGDAKFPVGPSQYSAEFHSSPALGYIIGVSWSQPETGTFVRLSYESTIKHDVTFTEQSPFVPAVTSTLPIKYPQSLTLNAQTGIAKDTVLLASVRWSDWSSFDLSIPGLEAFTGPLISGGKDSVSVTLGIGHKFNDTWSGALLLSKMSDGSTTSFLAPSSGRKSVTLALRHETGKATLGLGVQYSWLSDAQTAVPTPFGPAPASFNGNKALAMVADVKFRF